MAKRFTDTDKWKKSFFTDLDMKGKLVWFYLLDNCDNTGVWSINYKLMSFQIGFSVDAEKIYKWFGDKIKLISDDKIFIESFIGFQYGELNQNNNAHKPVIKLLKKLEENEPLISPSLGAQDKDKDKAQAKDMDKDKDKDKKDDFFDFTHPLDLPCDKLTPEKIVESWNDGCEQFGMPKILKLNDQRKKKLKNFMNDVKTLEDWQNIFLVASTKSFTGKDGRKFIPSFDYILEKGRHLSLLEESKLADLPEPELSEAEAEKVVRNYMREQGVAI